MVKKLIQMEMIAILVLGIGTAPVWASRHKQNQENFYSKYTSLLVVNEEKITLKKAATMVRKKTGGRILSAEQQDQDDVAQYRFKVLMPNGVVKIMYVDSASGAIR